MVLADLEPIGINFFCENDFQGLISGGDFEFELYSARNPIGESVADRHRIFKTIVF